MGRLLFLAILLVVGVAGCADPAITPAVDGDDSAVAEVEAAVREFIRSIDQLDLDGVTQSFASDASAFYPFSFTPARLEGRDQIIAEQVKGFEWARKALPSSDQSAPVSLGLTPSDMTIQLLGSELRSCRGTRTDRPMSAGARLFSNATMGNGSSFTIMPPIWTDRDRSVR